MTGSPGARATPAPRPWPCAGRPQEHGWSDVVSDTRAHGRGVRPGDRTQGRTGGSHRVRDRRPTERGAVALAVAATGRPRPATYVIGTFTFAAQRPTVIALQQERLMDGLNTGGPRRFENVRRDDGTCKAGDRRPAESTTSRFPGPGRRQMPAVRRDRYRSPRPATCRRKPDAPSTDAMSWCRPCGAAFSSCRRRKVARSPNRDGAVGKRRH